MMIMTATTANITAAISIVILFPLPSSLPCDSAQENMGTIGHIEHSTLHPKMYKFYMFAHYYLHSVCY